jgi:hypothetical protein
VISTPGIAQQQDSSPLTIEEGRETAANLLEGLAWKDRAITLQKFVEQLMELDSKQRQLYMDSLELERRLRAVTERERDVEKSRGDQLQALLNARNKQPGFWCKLKRVVTLGQGRCG